MSGGSKPKVVVIGGGMAGAAAADALRDKAEVILLEAKNRTGGRTWTYRWDDGAWIDLGAAWVHGTGSSFPMHHLFKKFGVDIDHRFTTDGMAATSTLSMWEARGTKDVPEPATRVSYCNLACCNGLAMYRFGNAFAAEMEKIPQGAKDESMKQVLDRMQKPQGNWCCGFRGFDGYGGERGLFMRNLPEFAANAATGMSTQDLSINMFGDKDLPAPSAAGNMMGVPNGGWQLICDGLLKDIDVRLNSPVKAIRESGNSVEVELRSGEKLPCSACIVTVPLGVLKAGDIAFEPSLPQPKQMAIEKIGNGNVMRVAVRFDKNFWSHHTATPLWQRIPVCEARREVDALEFTTWADWSKMVGKPIIQCFFYADTALKAESMTDKEILDNFLKIMCTHFPKNEVMAAKIVDAQITRWTSDEFSKGAYSGPSVGMTSDHRKELQRAHGRVHFAGEATSTGLSASVHGAYLTGIQAAEEALAHGG